MKKCVICGEHIKGYGHNPQPLAESGECCDYCNYKKVVVARILLETKTALVFTRSGVYTIRPLKKKFTLKELQNLVDGYIEIAPPKFKDFEIIVNENGLIENLYPNEKAYDFLGEMYVGNVVFCPRELIE